MAQGAARINIYLRNALSGYLREAIFVTGEGVGSCRVCELNFEARGVVLLRILNGVGIADGVAVVPNNSCTEIPRRYATV